MTRRGAMQMLDKDSHQDLEALIRAAQQGHPGARGLLIEHHYPWILSAIRLQSDATLRCKESSMDMAQVLCIEVLEHLGEFEYRGDESFRSWLFAWIKNLVRNRQRYYLAEKRDARREVSMVGLGGDNERILLGCYSNFCTPSSEAVAHDEIRRIEQAMDLLPRDYRDVIIQAQLMNLPHTEIAKRMCRSPEATRVLLHRAMAKLVAALTLDG